MGLLARTYAKKLWTVACQLQVLAGTYVDQIDPIYDPTYLHDLIIVSLLYTADKLSIFRSGKSSIQDPWATKVSWHKGIMYEF